MCTEKEREGEREREKETERERERVLGFVGSMPGLGNLSIFREDKAIVGSR